MHCVSAYPVPNEQINLRAIKTIEEEFNCPIGYSDHTDGIDAAIIAVGIGATVIEKHITLDKKLPGPDHKASLEPNKFKMMVEGIRNCECMLGNGKKEPQPSEINTRAIARRSIRALGNIKRDPY